MAEKKEMRDRVKSIWIKGMKVIGNTAASIANNTRYKVDEVTIQNRRREVLSDLAHKTYALWLKGECFPEPVTRLLDELKRLDEQLNDMRAEKYASSQKPAELKQTDDGSASEEESEEEYEIPDGAPPADSPVSTEINELFDSTYSVGRSVQKVNNTLEQMSERIRSFPMKDSENEDTEGQE